MIRSLTFIYDGNCGFCQACKAWLLARDAFIPLRALSSTSPQTLEEFPKLSNLLGEELVVVSDEGGVYIGADAWIMCLYALREYREHSIWLSRPMYKPLAKAAFKLISRQRHYLSMLFFTSHLLSMKVDALPESSCTLTNEARHQS